MYIYYDNNYIKSMYKYIIIHIYYNYNYTCIHYNYNYAHYKCVHTCYYSCNIV